MILLESKQGSSLHGVALAWLLEYEVVYFFELVDDVDIVINARNWSKEAACLVGTETEGNAIQNALSGIALVLIEVKIDAQTTLYQFTFPITMTNAVARKLKLVEGNLQDICEAIRTRLVKRTCQASKNLGLDFDICVTSQQVTMDRVAL